MQMRESPLINCIVANYADGVEPVDSTKGTEILMNLLKLHIQVKLIHEVTCQMIVI